MAKRDYLHTASTPVFEDYKKKFAYSALGADRILFAVDHPHESSTSAVQFIEVTPISDSDKEKIYHLNAEKLLAL